MRRGAYASALGTRSQGGLGGLLVLWGSRVEEG